MNNGHADSFGQIHFVNETDNIITGQGDYGYKRSAAEAGLDSDSDNQDHAGKKALPPNPSITPKMGKKTRGRVKIEMKFIENKLRRYTTFSKRKTGIMKKAYELSTLTGTQVMLLVASETGHVYTFATRKLQPMITSESGKALIQTCLNSPDVGGSLGASPHAEVTGLGGLGGDQRMNPGGFEETELNYTVEDDQPKTMDPSSPSDIKQVMPPLSLSPTPSPNPPGHHSRTPFSDNGSSSDNNLTVFPGMATPPPSASTPSMTSNLPQTISINSYIGPAPGVNVGVGGVGGGGGKGTNMTMQLAAAAGGLVLPQQGLPAGMTVASIPASQNNNSPTQATQAGAATATLQYKIPTGPQAGQIISLQGIPGLAAAAAGTVSPNNNNSSSSSAPASTQQSPTLAAQPVAVMASGATPMMYQTPQGMVYAPGGMSLPEGFVLSPTLAIPQPSAAGGSGGGETPSGGAGQCAAATQQQQQHFITIPVPVSLASGQMFQPFIAQQQQQAASADRK